METITPHLVVNLWQGQKMNNLSRNELIKALVKGLKLDDNIFNYQAVAEEIELIKECDFVDFYKDVMRENTYGNGLQAIMKVADQFKPVITDKVEKEAKELIELCEGLNTQIRKDAERMGEDFVKLVRSAKFPTLDNDKIIVLNNVKPYNDFRDLIIHIRHYQTAQDSLGAFMYAIKYIDKTLTAIESKAVRKMIKA